MIGLKPATRAAYRLLHEGSLALADVEANGMRLDIPRIKRTIEKTNNKINRMNESLRKQEIFKIWKKEFGDRAKLDSPEQLGHVVFNCLAYKATKFTATGKPKTDVAALEEVEIPFVRKYLEAKLLKKAVSTYLTGFLREQVDGFLRAFINIHDIITFRSSSDCPNLQNIPARNPNIAALIRRCFIPRKGHVILDLDFKAVEVRVAACYTKDPVLLKYCRNPKSDMHKDMAMRLFLLSEGQVTKPIRHSAKNNFVFAQFYGDYFLHCAKNLWESIHKNNLMLPNGRPLKKHLKSKGINWLGSQNAENDKHYIPAKDSFEHHVKKVEDWYWNTQYRVYTQWKDSWWKEYLRYGGFHTYTGFTVEGIFRRNQVLNSPIQGSAFHCCLWLIVKLNDWLKRKGMRSCIIAEVHDSLVLDVAEKELEAVRFKVVELLEQLQDEWKWIIVPLSVEAKISEVNGNWSDQTDFDIAA